jgi:predicted Rossmann-fold nucleotide-binding protein
VATSSSPAERPVVAVLGSARLTEGDPRYATAAAVGTALAGEGWTVMTGGYGGLMQAAGAAAAAAGAQVIGLPMRGWTALTPGPWSTQVRWCETYAERLGHLLACDAVVALDGGIGTLSELSVVWAAAQTEDSAPAVVAVGPAWRTLLATVRDRLVVGDEDLALVTVVDGADDVAAAVRTGLGASRLAVPRG